MKMAQRLAKGIIKVVIAGTFVRMFNVELIAGYQ
jgi:hypothetical protein